VVTRNGTLRADFFRDIWLVEYVRKEFDRKEIAYLQDILEEGVRTKIFEITDVPKRLEFFIMRSKDLKFPLFVEYLVSISIISRIGIRLSINI